MKTNYTDTELQAAIDKAFPKGARESGLRLDNKPGPLNSWESEAPYRLAIIKAALAAFGNQSQLRPISEAGPLPEGCVRVTGFFANDMDNGSNGWVLSEWTSPRDTHFADIQLPPAKAEVSDEHETFEAHGKIWTQHTPGDAMPCENGKLIEILMKDGNIGRGNSKNYGYWGEIASASIIGWRYADEPTPEPLEPAPWTPKVGDVVTLKSGGPKMTVTQDIGHKFLCAYDTRNEVKTISLPTTCLQPA